MTLTVNLFVAFVVFLITIYFYKKNFKVFFINGLIVYQAATIIPSLIYIETNKFISEQGRMGYFVGSVLLFSLFYIITLVFINASFNSFNKVKIRSFDFKYKKINVENELLLLISISVLVLLFINLLLSPIPLFTEHVSRFNYWELSKFPFFNKIFGNTAVFIPFALGVIFNKYKKSSIILLIVYFGYNFLIGQKYSPIIQGSFSFLLPIIIKNTKPIPFKKILSFRNILITFLLISVMYKVIYKKYEERRPFAIIKIYDPNEAIIYRIFGLQAHLFWGASESFVYKDAKKSWDPRELNKGMHKMMLYFSSADKKGLQESMNGGFSYTNAYPAVLFMIFPVPIAYLFHILIVIFILSLSGWILMRLIKNKSYLLALVSYQFFIWTVYALTMGYFYKLKYGILFNIFILLVSYLLEMKSKSKLRLKK